MAANKVEQLKLEEQALSPVERARIREKFNKYDTDGNGTLDKQEFRSLLEETLNRKISDKLFDKYLEIQFSLTDTDFNGVIDFQEFCSLYSKIYTNPEIPIHMAYKSVEKKVQLEDGSNAPKVQKAVEAELTEEQLSACKAKFDQYDADKSGSIDKAELKELLKETMGSKMSEKTILRYVDMQFSMWDKDENGLIDFDEFTKLYAKMYLAPNEQAAPGVGMGVGLPFPAMMRGSQ